MKQATFQTTAPVPTGAGGVAGISDEDEAMHQVIAASLADREAGAPAGPSGAAAIDFTHASSDASGEVQPAQAGRTAATEAGGEPPAADPSQSGDTGGGSGGALAAPDSSALPYSLGSAFTRARC